MPRLLVVALIAALFGACAVVPAADAARAKHGKQKKRHRVATWSQSSSDGVLQVRKRDRPAYGRLVAVKPASRPPVAAPVASAPSRPPSAPAAELPLPANPVEALGSFASVRARDSATNFSFTLSRPALAVGPISLQLQNSGEDPHDLTVAPAAGGAQVATTGTIEPGGTGSLSTTLPAGRYRLYCSLYSHAARGMQVSLDVR